MRVAIVSDTHFGYGWDTEREDDCFENAREAFRRTVDADLVLLPGDIYDHKVPKQEVLSRSIDCFNEYKKGECNIEIHDDSDATYKFNGTPVVGIHGTHERRSKGFVNPMELLHKMGYLLHIHNETVIFEHPDSSEKVAVHGMSGVPERYAPGVLEKFDPQPVEDAYNIFMFHQSVEKFVYTSKDHSVLKLEHMPDGFDLLVDGHIHWRNTKLHGSDKPMILPGSTISTQMRKVEAEEPKGFVIIDTEENELEFKELENQRDLFYEEIEVDGMSGSEIHNAVEKRMQEVCENVENTEKKPLVRIILQGKTDATVKLSEFRKQYKDDVVLSITKRLKQDSDTISADAFQEQTKSIAEMGRDILRQKIAATDHGGSLHLDSLFELLAEEELENALELVEEMELEEDDSEKAGEDSSEVENDDETAEEKTVEEEAEKETRVEAESDAEAEELTAEKENEFEEASPTTSEEKKTLTDF